MGSSFTAVHTIHYIDPATVQERIAKPGDLLSGLPEDVTDRLEAVGAVIRIPDDEPLAEPSEADGLESEEAPVAPEELPPAAEQPVPVAEPSQKPKSVKAKGKAPAADATAGEDDDLI